MASLPYPSPDATPSAENDAPCPGRLFAHSVITTGYNGPEGPEPVIFEITEVTDDGRVYYGPAQRGIETTGTLWIWEHLFRRDALGAWVGTRLIPPGAQEAPMPSVEDALIAADVIERFAAVGADDTPGFAALLDDFPTLGSRGNLKVILWALAKQLRGSVNPPADGGTDE